MPRRTLENLAEHHGGAGIHPSAQVVCRLYVVACYRRGNVLRGLEFCRFRMEFDRLEARAHELVGARTGLLAVIGIRESSRFEDHSFLASPTYEERIPDREFKRHLIRPLYDGLRNQTLPCEIERHLISQAMRAFENGDRHGESYYRRPHRGIQRHALQTEGRSRACRAEKKLNRSTSRTVQEER